MSDAHGPAWDRGRPICIQCGRERTVPMVCDLCWLCRLAAEYAQAGYTKRAIEEPRTP